MYIFNNIPNKNTKGFTLIEVLLVMALLAILASIVIYAINPSKQLADSRDVQREVDLYSLMQAIYQFSADNEGSYPDSITVLETEICRTDAVSCSGVIDLSALTDNETYLITVPEDPLCDVDSFACSNNGTGYFIKLTASGSLALSATSSENKVITVIQ